MKLTNSQKVDLFDINFDLGYFSKQNEIQERLKLINVIGQMTSYYIEINNKQKESDKKQMFASFLDNVLSLCKIANQNSNYISSNISELENLKNEIEVLKSLLKIKDDMINTLEKVNKEMLK